MRHNILISCTEQEAECIQIEDNYYHAGWMKVVREDIGAITADVIEIDKEEYDELYELIEHDEEIEPYPEPEPSPESEPEPEDITVAYAKKLKLKDMSNTCNNIIFAGIDVVLSDEETHHFSLTEYDQLNLFKLETLARSSQEVLPYHEDGELCKFYPAVDIIAIANAATQYIAYHTTYFNSLKAYINSLRSLNTISRVTYGMDIPEKYQSDVWKEINRNDET
ncbi:hypothetical protein SAMN02910441_00107 [Ruminococcus sp. YE282]|nr:hypothetical protein SAMN02910441_00107 [Ruminococcus bromii]